MEKLQEYPIENSPFGILILPGGSYSSVSDLEGECVAKKFNTLGVTAYVLKYSVAPKRFPTAILEVAQAIEYIKTKNRSKVVVCGFSAGGHLAASIATLHDTQIITKYYKNSRPDAVILCYPVISIDKKFCHKQSFINLCGIFNKKLKVQLSLENRVSQTTPPMYIWHTLEDEAVPYQNSVLMAKALKSKNILCKLELFPKGRHGLSLASEESGNDNKSIFEDVKQWPSKAINWLNLILFK